MRVSSSLDPDQVPGSVRPALGPNCLERLSADNTSRQRVERYLMIECLTLYPLVSSADNLCKQFGPRSGPTEHWARSGSKLFDTLMVFLKEFFEKIDFGKKISADDKRA